MIIIGANKEDSGAYIGGTYQCYMGEDKPSVERPIYVKLIPESVGTTLKVWESYWGDGDYVYYATYWNMAENKPVTVCYGSNRGYEHTSATVDATPEVQTLFKAYEIERLLALEQAKDKEQAEAPRQGKLCLVVKGRKIKKGEQVSVIRTGSFDYMGNTTTQALCWVTTPTGLKTQVWTNVDNLQVINPEQYITSPETLRAQIASRLN